MKRAERAGKMPANASWKLALPGTSISAIDAAVPFLTEKEFLPKFAEERHLAILLKELQEKDYG